VKVISGIYKGRVLDGYTMNGTRPTMDRVKESLFAMIQNKIKESIILDLFSGSGNLGIEALSEGAKEAYLVDYNKKATKTIEKNLNKLEINNCKVLAMDYLKALTYLKNENKIFDIIFLDPPYQTDYIEIAIKKILELDILNDEGIIACETDQLSKIYQDTRVSVIKEKKYGDKYIVLLKKI